MASSTMRGDVAVLILMAKFAEAGLVVLQPVCESLPFDVVLYHEELFYRVQVKRAQSYERNAGRWVIPFRKAGPSGDGYKMYHYDSTHADFLCGVVVETGDIYVFPLDVGKKYSDIQVDPNRVSSRQAPNRKIDPEMFRNIIKLGGKEFRF